MEPSAVERIWNPFTWRLRELASLSDDQCDVARREQLSAELVVAEAREAARGVRHVTVVHGDPRTLSESRLLDRLYTSARETIETAPWWRFRGGEDHVIVAAGGDHASTLIAEVADRAESMNPGHWQIVAGARPDLRCVTA